MSPESLEHITINGQKLSSKDGLVLKPNDRIIFGTNSVFLFKDETSSVQPSIADSSENPVSWEEAQKERSDIEDAGQKQAKDEMFKKQEAEAKAKMEELKKQEEQIRIKMQKEYEEKLKALQKQANAEEQKAKLEEEMKRKEEERKVKLE